MKKEYIIATFFVAGTTALGYFVPKLTTVGKDDNPMYVKLITAGIGFAIGGAISIAALKEMNKA